MGQRESNLLLSFDLSTKSTGWAIKDLDTQELIDYGCITARAADPIERIRTMYTNIVDILKSYPSIDIVIAEEVRLDDISGYVHKLLTYVQFAMINAIYTVNPRIEYQFILPSSWRAKLGIRQGRGIKRDEQKLKDIEYVKNKYNCQVNDDIADAICIADSYFINNQEEKGAW